MPAATLTAAEVDRWSLPASGLGERVTRCATRAGCRTVGDLRTHLGHEQRVPGLGRVGRRQAEAFFSLAAAPLPVTMRGWLAAVLTPAELAVIELRYGLTDRLWRPTMALCTYRQIGAERGITAARAGQICRGARRRLQSRLGRALVAAVAGQVRSPLPATDWRSWRGQAWLGGYEPWGALALLEEMQ
jgi:hypothetical protein